jgi:hypothetical protein
MRVEWEHIGRKDRRLDFLREQFDRAVAQAMRGDDEALLVAIRLARALDQASLPTQ